MKRLGMVLIATLLPAILIPAHPASAAMVCAKRSDVTKRLKQRFDEKPTSIGIIGENLLELYTSKQGSFTVVITRANGVSCLVLAGENWRQVKQKDTES